MLNKGLPIDKEAVIRFISDDAGLNLGDSRAALNALVKLFEQCISEQVDMDVRGWGHLYYIQFPARKGFDAFRSMKKSYPPAIKVNFSLSKNLRDIVRSGGEKNGDTAK